MYARPGLVTNYKLSFEKPNQTNKQTNRETKNKNKSTVLPTLKVTYACGWALVGAKGKGTRGFG